MNIFDAAATGNIPVIQSLLDEGIDINYRNPEFKSTALHQASRFSNSSSSLETVKFLLDKGADTEIGNRAGFNPIHIASWFSNTSSSIDTIRLLLDRGANVNHQNGINVTALMLSSGETNGTSSLDTVRLLLDRGANVNHQTVIGVTALMISSNGTNGTSNIDTVRLLLEYGANVNLRDNRGWSALMDASFNVDSTSSLDTVKTLLEAGANITYENNEGKNAIDLCSTQECKQVIGKYAWNQLSKVDSILTNKLSEGSKLPKDVWELIVLNRRQQQLCSDLSSRKNREILWYFAEMLNIPLNQNLTKGQLCGLISKQLAYGKYYDEKTEFKQRRMTRSEILRVAQKYNINTNQSLFDIISNLDRLFGI